MRLSVCVPVSSKFLNKSRLSISKSQRSHTLTSSDCVCDTYRFVSLHTSQMDLAHRLQCISGFRFIRTSFLVNCASQSSQALLGTRFSFIPFMSTNSGRLRRCLGTGPLCIDDFDSLVNTSPIFEKNPPGVTSEPDRCWAGRGPSNECFWLPVRVYAWPLKLSIWSNCSSNPF